MIILTIIILVFNPGDLYYLGYKKIITIIILACIQRFSRDFTSVPEPLNAHTALQLCSDYGLLLFL